MELALGFSAGEFLDEFMEYIKEKHGNIPFLTTGKFVHNKDSQHPYEWWAERKDIDELNKLISEEDTSTNIIHQL